MALEPDQRPVNSSPSRGGDICPQAEREAGDTGGHRGLEGLWDLALWGEQVFRVFAGHFGAWPPTLTQAHLTLWWSTDPTSSPL